MPTTASPLSPSPLSEITTKPAEVATWNNFLTCNQPALKPDGEFNPSYQPKQPLQ